MLNVVILPNATERHHIALDVVHCVLCSAA